MFVFVCLWIFFVISISICLLLYIGLRYSSAVEVVVSENGYISYVFNWKTEDAHVKEMILMKLKEKFDSFSKFRMRTVTRKFLNKQKRKHRKQQKRDLISYVSNQPDTFYNIFCHQVLSLVNIIISIACVFVGIVLTFLGSRFFKLGVIIIGLTQFYFHQMYSTPSVSKSQCESLREGIIPENFATAPYAKIQHTVEKFTIFNSNIFACAAPMNADGAADYHDPEPRVLRIVRFSGSRSHSQQASDRSELHRFNNRIEGMTEAQQEAQRLRDTARRTGKRCVQQQWDYDNPCEHCGCVWLKSDTANSRKMCCNNGHWASNGDGIFPALQPLPDVIRIHATNNGNEFSTKSAFYNNLFSTAITCVDNGRQGIGFETMNMTAAVTVNGRTYNRFPDSTMSSCGVANFIHDGLTAHVDDINERNSTRHSNRLDHAIAESIRQEFENINPYAQDLIAIGRAFTELNGNETIPIYTTSLPIPTHRLEVSILINQNPNDGIIYQYRTHDNKTSFLNSKSDEVEPLCYPLLFPYGERGWGSNLKASKIHLMPYLAARLLQPEENLHVNNKAGNKLLNVNRFNLMSRVSQYWLVDSVSRSLDNQLTFQRNNQQYILGDNHGERPIDEDRETITTATFLSDSVMGSPRHRKKLACNALAIAAELGKPHLFTTITANTNWPEIQEMLLPGQSAYERMDVVCRVFHARKNAIIHNIKHGHYFDGKCAYILHVIEYQHRGLPHAHIVYRLENGPDHNDKIACINFIDKYISAKRPLRETDASAEHQRYVNIVESFMVHDCRQNDINGCLDAEGFCKKRFNPIPNPNTCFDERSYPLYARPHSRDCYIVPHVKEMILDGDCHINTEFCASNYSLIYLYKYLFKGNKKIQMKLNNTDDVDESDEIKLFLRGRMLSSMEACWRVFNYPTYPASSPSVSTIKLKTFWQLKALNDAKKLCDFRVYLDRPHALRNITFTKFFKSFDYSYKKPPRFANATPLSLISSSTGEFQCEEMDFDDIDRPVYLYRLNSENQIIRLGSVPFDSGELWYLRLLIRNTTPTNFRDLYTCNGIRYESFQDACVAHGLLDNDTEADISFSEALIDSSPPQLRSFFVLLTIQGYPTLRIYKDHCLRLQEDLANENELLQDLQQRFNRENKNMEDYGLSAPMATRTLLDCERAKINQTESESKLASLHRLQPNTEEMEPIYDEIISAINNQNRFDPVKIFAIDAMGGSGKTTFAKKIYHYCHSTGKIILGAAATGLAAQVYGDLDFETLHTQYCVPILEEDDDYENINDIQCNVERKPQRVELINAAEVLIFDEVFSNHKYCISAIMKTFNQLQGKVVIFLMDRGQTAPVVKFGSRSQIVDSTIMTLPLWNTIRRFSLTKNLRLLAMQNINPNDPHFIRQRAYATALSQFRTNGPFDPHGPIQEVQENLETGEKFLRFEGYQYFTNQLLALKFIYPQRFNTPNIQDRAILCSKNKECDEWNNTVQEMNPEPAVELLSSNRIDEIDDPHSIIDSMLNDNTLEYWNKPGVPPHRLSLKKGDICFLLQTVSKKDHLSRNTRVKIHSISRYRVQVITLNENPKLCSIPRIRFKISHAVGFTLIRTQFPLALAYAMTKNKAQGQSLQWSLNDIRNPSFSHGQEYVALSRPVDYDQVAIFCNSSQIIEDAVVISNTVYSELLTN